MSVEPVGATLAVAGLLVAFKGAVDSYLFLGSFFDKDKGNDYLGLRYHIEKHKFIIWGDFFKTSNPENCTLLKQPLKVQEIVMRIIDAIAKTQKEAKVYVEKHGLEPETASPDQANGKATATAAPAPAGKPKNAAPKGKLRGVFKWVIKNRDIFSELVARLQELNKALYEVLQPADIDLLNKTLSSYVLALLQKQDSGYIQRIQDPQAQTPQLLRLSASLMSLEQQPANAAKQVTEIPKARLKLTDDKWSTGVYQDGQGIYHSVWVEWTILDPRFPSYETLRYRSEVLTGMLQTASEPSLRTPPCLGLFDDIDFEVRTSKKRIGRVFSVPPGDYEDDLHKYPPTTLKQLLRATRSDPPPLGDRIQLAFELASAFSLFHASGWLHKGFRSENIIFLQRTNGGGVNIREPFVTGFQASRGHEDISVKPMPSAAGAGWMGDVDVEMSETEYYYHLDSQTGFTKALDLYSLGVVLCEIGRWDLLADLVPEAKKDNLADRIWATKFVTGDPLGNLAWRMGDLYAGAARTLLLRELPNDSDIRYPHEFFTKVLQPLGTCRV